MTAGLTRYRVYGIQVGINRENPMKLAACLLLMPLGFCSAVLADEPPASAPQTPAVQTPAAQPPAAQTQAIQPQAPQAPAPSAASAGSDAKAPSAAAPAVAAAGAKAGKTELASTGPTEAQIKQMRGRGYKPVNRNGTLVFCRDEGEFGTHFTAHPLQHARTTERGGALGQRVRQFHPATRLGGTVQGPVTDRSPRIRTVTASRYVTPLREGGSLPAIIEADDDGLVRTQVSRRRSRPESADRGAVGGRDRAARRTAHSGDRFRGAAAGSGAHRARRGNSKPHRRKRRFKSRLGLSAGLGHLRSVGLSARCKAGFGRRVVRCIGLQRGSNGAQRQYADVASAAVAHRSWRGAVLPSRVESSATSTRSRHSR